MLIQLSRFKHVILKRQCFECSVFLFVLSFLLGAVKSTDPYCDSGYLNEMVFSLSGCNLDWPDAKFKCEYIASGKYKGTDIIHTRFQMCGDKTILLQPKYRPGVPFSVGQICLKSNMKCNPCITPYPCWSLHDPCSCEAIVNAVDLYLDCKGIVWFLDVGIVNTLEAPEKKCGPKVLGVHCESGKVVSVIELCSLVCSTSRLQYIVVDYNDDGYPIVMVSDGGSRAILVWNTMTNEGYRVQLPKAVLAGGGKRDVLYIILVRRGCGSNFLYFSYLSSDHMFYVKSNCLHQKTKTGCVMDVGKKPNKIVLLGTDNGQVIFFRLCNENNIYMWDTNLAFKEYNFILAQKPLDCRIPTHVAAGYRRLVWVLESNFQDYIQNCVGCLGASSRLHPIIKPNE
ncbi:hypothetical protein M8J75_014276 [Diaphorina citri]|nr:hypothetical protein M8J75_014276 [Diaphorina citri]KAI5726205.1 hypothetical protein M8J77_025220 [Diaphorina citri]